MRKSLCDEKFYKTFWFIKVMKNNKPLFHFGTHKRELRLSQNYSDISWYIKEYGYKTSQSARRGIKSLNKYLKKLGCEFDCLDVESCRMEFSVSDAKRLRYLK